MAGGLTHDSIGWERSYATVGKITEEDVLNEWVVIIDGTGCHLSPLY